MRRKGGIRVESSLSSLGQWSRSRQLASARSAGVDLQFERYLVTACSLMLAVVLVVSAAGYAVIEGLSSSTTTTAKLAILEQLNRQADLDRVLTPAAIALAMIAVFPVAMVARLRQPAQVPNRYPMQAPMANSQYTMPRNTSSFNICK
jgi:hypothetical protein